jgi:hypothetical protein
MRQWIGGIQQESAWPSRSESVISRMQYSASAKLSGEPDAGDCGVFAFAAQIAA